MLYILGVTKKSSPLCLRDPFFLVFLYIWNNISTIEETFLRSLCCGENDKSVLLYTWPITLFLCVLSCSMCFTTHYIIIYVKHDKGLPWDTWQIQIIALYNNIKLLLSLYMRGLEKKFQQNNGKLFEKIISKMFTHFFVFHFFNIPKNIEN